MIAKYSYFNVLLLIFVNFFNDFFQKVNSFQLDYEDPAQELNNSKKEVKNDKIHLKSLYDQVKYFSINYLIDCDNIYESCLHNAEVARKI